MNAVGNMFERVRAEFVEMPGLRLTPTQVQRLCGVEPTTCDIVLATLVEAKFLSVSPNGTYGRLTDGNVSRPRLARAELRNRHTKAS